MSISQTYIQYGVSAEVANGLESKKLPVSTFRNTSKINLMANYGLDSDMIDFVNNSIRRQPIPEETILLLLENNNYCCCLCKDPIYGFIIHHIVEYATNQDNLYDNLAVLCPNHHNEAHKEGVALTKRITPDQIKQTKKKWKNDVKVINAQAAVKATKEFDRLDQTKINLEQQTITDDHAKNVNIDYQITPHTKFVFSVHQTYPEQEFIIFLYFNTDQGDGKWIGFGTPINLKNVFTSERVFRIGRPGFLEYNGVEFILERIKESGLLFKGHPLSIKTIKFWGWHQNLHPITFDYALLD